MKLRASNKRSTPALLAGTLVVFIAVLIYVSGAGRHQRPQRLASQKAVPAGTMTPQTAVPPAGGRTGVGTAQVLGTASAGPTTKVPRPADQATGGTATPAAPSAPASKLGPSAAPSAPASKLGPSAASSAPASKLGASAAPSAPASKLGTAPGKAAPAGPHTALAPAPQAGGSKDPEAAVVGTGVQGRNDPFSPLVIPGGGQVARGPTLPPPPGVGLPMPPGFATPAPGPSAAPPPPGAGLHVTGIMGSRQRVAIIETDGKTYIVGPGERVGDAVVVSISSDKVIMKQNNVTFELGFGGETS